MSTNNPRFTIIADDELLKRIDDFRFENRFNSRSAAAVELIRIGLEQVDLRKSEQKSDKD